MAETYNEPDAKTTADTERTPLLADGGGNIEYGVIIPTSADDGGAQSGVDSLQVEDEPTNREIALTMSCIWVLTIPKRMPMPSNLQV